MSLERVIAEQQTKIDQLTEQVDSLSKSSAHVWKQHEELFEAIAVFLDANLPLDRSDESSAKHYLKLRHELRLAMLQTGYCLRCYNFICQCDDHE